MSSNHVWNHISLPTHFSMRFNLPTKISLHWISSVIFSRQRHSCHQSAETHWPLPTWPLCSLRYHRSHHPPPTPWNLVWNHQHCPKLVSVIHFGPYFFSRHWRLKIHTSPNHLWCPPRLGSRPSSLHNLHYTTESSPAIIFHQPSSVRWWHADLPLLHPNFIPYCLWPIAKFNQVSSQLDGFESTRFKPSKIWIHDIWSVISTIKLTWTKSTHAWQYCAHNLWFCAKPWNDLW
jgi:hypothetical protein